MEDVQTSDRRELQMASRLPLFFLFLIFPQNASLSDFTLFVPLFSSMSLSFLTDVLLTEVVTEIGMCSQLDPAAEMRQVFEPEWKVCVGGGFCFLKRPPSVHMSLFHTFSFSSPQETSETLKAKAEPNF